MTARSSYERLVALSFLFGLLAAGCGNSADSPGQIDGGSGGRASAGTGGGLGGFSASGGAGATGGAVGIAGRGGGTGGTGHGGSAGGSGGGGAGGTGHGGTGGTATGGTGGTATGGTGGTATGGTGGTATGGGGGMATGGSGGASTGGGGGMATGGAAGVGGQGGAGVCSSAPLVACPTDQICDYDTPSRCGAGYEPGHCIVLPGGCTTDYNPVCGCDGHTYSNDCSRKMARAQLDHTGACAGTGGTGGINCGGVLTCDASQTYCDSFTGGTAGSTPGYSCKLLPTACVAPPTCTCICPTPSTGCTLPSSCTCTQDSNGLIKVSCYGA